MKKGKICLAIVLLAVFLLINFGGAIGTNNSITGGASITGDTVTGKVSASLAVTVTIMDLPSVVIDKPKNETYFANSSLKLDIISNGNNFWYNIDEGLNVSMGNSKNSYINISFGGHRLYVYANNSAGINGTNVNFSTSQGIFAADNSRYEIEEEYHGNSTNFNEYTFKEIQNLTEIVFEDTTKGKIDFGNQIINVSNDSDYSDGIVNFTKYINISFNRIELNSSALPNFNKNATLIFYDLTFSNPRILKDGAVCSADACKRNYFNGAGDLSFNVSGFSVYSAEETPSAGDETPAPSGGQQTGGGGGSGGGSILAVNKGFEILQDSLRVSLRQGETERVQFTVENIGGETLNFSVSLSSSLKEVAIIRDEKFGLKAHERKMINLDAIALKNMKPDVYIGKIVVESAGVKKEVLVVVEINLEKSIFDVKASVSEIVFSKGDTVIFTEIDLTNLGQEKIDAYLNYSILNSDGEIVHNHGEMIGVETRASLMRKVNLGNIASGKYILSVNLQYGGDNAISSAVFEINREGIFRENILLWAIATFIFLLIIIIIIMLARINKVLSGKRIIDDKMIIKRGYIKR